MRIAYSQVFETLPTGAVTPKVLIQIGGVQLGPGVSFTSGVQFGGLDLAKIQGKDLEVTVTGSTYVITGYYQ